MSYNRTVTCSHCWMSGHNRAGCPKLKEYIANNPNSYEASQRLSKKNRPRKCSYCTLPGHNRKTCEMLSETRANLHARNKKFRAAVLTHLKNYGIGVGALAEWKEDSWGSPVFGAPIRGIVNSIRWRELNIWQAATSYYGMPAVSCISLVTMATKGIATPAQWLARIPQDEGYFGEPELCSAYASGGTTNQRDGSWLLSALSPENVEKSVPSNWLDGTDGALEEYFSNDTNYRHHEWLLNPR